MSKELLKPQQFCKAELLWEDAEYQLSAEEIEALAELYGGTVQQYKRGSIIKATILAINPEGVLVDINFKSQGLIPLHEFSEHEIKKLVQGAVLDVILDELEDIDGNVAVSYQKAKALKAWDEILKVFQEGKPVEGVVLHKVKGGLSVDVGVPAFLPGSQVDVQRVADFDIFVGQTITAYILKVNQRRGNVIISRRKYLHEQRSEGRRKILDQLEVGQVIQGVVKNITNYGAFIDIGDVDGLLHITDMTWGRISHPSEMLTIGETIPVKVLSFDRENEKISLGIKQLEANPWEALGETVTIGSTIKGVVSSIADYGLFVEVAKGVEGLVHISEISWSDRISDLNRHFKVGQEIEAAIVSLDKENRRMSLSIKQLEKNPWETLSDQFKIGQTVTGKITNLTDFGLFVQVIPGVDGLVHISDISWTEHVKSPADLYKRGQEIEAVITDINQAKKKVSLSIKHTGVNPWDTIEQEYPVGSSVEGEVSRIGETGAFVKLPNGIEGYAHISELSDEHVNRIDDVVKIGQKLMFKVIKLSPEDHRIGLSLRSEGALEEAAKRDSVRQARREMRETRRVEQPVLKAKSQFQIEFEKHTARLRENEQGARSVMQDTDKNDDQEG